MQSYDEVMDYQEYRWVKQITQGKADSFPIIGRKRDATDHEPGEQVLGGTITHDEVVVTMDKLIYDSAFIAEIDQLLAHYEFAQPYAHQIGQSLGSITAKRIAIMHILASRGGVTGAGQPVPAYYWNANLRTSGAALEDAAFKSKQYLLENDVSGSDFFWMMNHQQILIMARYTGTEEGITSGTGNRATGTIREVAGLTPKGTNHLPSGVVNTGLAKYQGDFTDTVGHIGSKMAVATLERRGMKMVMKDQPERFGTLLIGSMVNGHGTLRNECSIELRVSAIGGRAGLA